MSIPEKIFGEIGMIASGLAGNLINDLIIASEQQGKSNTVLYVALGVTVAYIIFASFAVIIMVRKNKNKKDIENIPEMALLLTEASDKYIDSSLRKSSAINNDDMYLFWSKVKNVLGINEDALYKMYYNDTLSTWEKQSTFLKNIITLLSDKIRESNYKR